MQLDTRAGNESIIPFVHKGIHIFPCQVRKEEEHHLRVCPLAGLYSSVPHVYTYHLSDCLRYSRALNRLSNTACKNERGMEGESVSDDTMEETRWPEDTMRQ